MTTPPTDIDDLARRIAAAMPPLDAEGRAVSLAVYRLLARGAPVDLTEVAESTGTPEPVARTLIDGWPGVYRDDAGRIVGFWGLALGEMPHRVDVAGVRLHTWCAWDALFIPALIGATASVASTCPVTGDEISLTVGASTTSKVAPDGARVSFLAPDEAFDADVVMRFCHYVLFFASDDAGRAWVAEHPGAFLVSVEEAFTVGALVNRARYGEVLHGAVS